jgi:uncharacterized membrane protein
MKEGFIYTIFEVLNILYAVLYVMDPLFVGDARAVVYIFMRSTSKNKNYAEDVKQGETIR